MPKKTSLHARHVASGARMVEFGGWEMPLEYTGITQEHLAVRTAAGVFDVSHMGELEIAGKDALAAVQSIFCNDAAKLQPGQAQYSAILTELGTFVDDVIVCRLRSDHFLIVVNAANTFKDYGWIAARAGSFGDAVVMDATSRYALIAVQGPAAAAVVQPLTGVDLASLKYYSFAHGEIANVRGTVSRTGYTGEDGFELFVPPQQADRVWQAILASGEPHGLIPCGLGARDTLRLEAGMRLYGNEIDETTTALEADLGWIVAWNKGQFVGAETLRAQKVGALTRKLIGFELTDPGVARHGYDVYVDGSRIGKVASGTQTPTVKKSIGMTYVPIAFAGHGQEFEIDIRGRRAHARVVPLPFYRRISP
ncbi:MAG TPA: glycine cleavage system aminomethyltransferase GcvT [Vicinamibacterales bacterium]|nr:glycine cleavage system aminomethyltransferase GcvT [Vicinamibacterales bacterium]